MAGGQGVRATAVALALLAAAGTCLGDDRPGDLAQLSLAELLELEVVSVSKKQQKLSETAAAIFVITQEDIRRSGATSIPEVLRMVPGVQVARMNKHTWSISARGFSFQFANKLLVLIDGRSVYTPLFGGVFWDVQDTLLEDIERIEVIRGPGASVWGANAVNGVINIITRHARDTQGGMVAAGYGNEEPGTGAVRHGGRAGDVFYRAYAKYQRYDESVDLDGKESDDDWDALRGGFRLDWSGSDDALSFHGDLYRAHESMQMDGPAFSLPDFRDYGATQWDAQGGSLLARWDRTLSETSDLTLQMYYDRVERGYDEPDILRDTFDVDFQHRFQLAPRLELLWGLGYRFTKDAVDGQWLFTLDPDSREDHLFSAFVQSELVLIEDRLRLVAGSKFEHNDYTGAEVQPSLRLLWTPHERHTLWAAVSRAIRMPSRIEHDGFVVTDLLPPGSLFPGSPLLALAMDGNDDLDADELLAWEVGYRIRLDDSLAIDLAAFYNDYRTLGTVLPGSIQDMPGPPPFKLVPFPLRNEMHGETYGGELSLDWRVRPGWRLAAAYSYLDVQLHLDEPAIGLAGLNQIGLYGEGAEGDAPHHQLSLRSHLDLPYDLEFDTALYYVDNLTNPGVSQYTRVDARLGWHPTEAFEFSLAGQNLLDDRHPESGTPLYSVPTEVERSVYAKVTWRF